MATLRERVFLRDGFRCGYCRHHDPTGATLAVDHVVPASWFVVGVFAGQNPDDPGNLATACNPCNQSKAVMDLATFALYLRRRYGRDTRALVRRVRASLARPLPP